MRRLLLLVVAGAVAACGSPSSSGAAPSGPAVVAASTADGGSGGDSDGGSGPVGAIDGGVTTKLPALPPMTHVTAIENDDSASITFDPVDGALDYRVYPLPGDGDIDVQGDGHVVVRNAIYRCAGDRESPAPNVDGVENTGSWVTTKVDHQMVGGYMRTLADSTLGYVYTEPGPDRAAVYALGESDANADDGCYFARWAQSRTKRYTTSEAERTRLLAAGARDDGIAFYVPAKDGGAATIPLFVDDAGAGTKYLARYYLAPGAEADAHPMKTPAFLALAAAAPGTQPLMRVFYANSCGWSHDELAVGRERFARAYKQGDALPEWSLLWSGLTGPTTLVVEALDSGCPYQGHLSPASIAATTAHFGTTPLPHPAYVTLDEVRAASPTTEVFVNGQHGATLPKAIARSFVRVAPRAHPKMDFFASFAPGAPPETFTTVPCGVPGGNCYQTWRQQSATFDQMFINAESGPAPGTGLFAAGPVLGELWVTYADVAADTNGKYRLTARQKASMDPSSYLHVTMEVDAVSTGRRYPQILISDQDIPVQYALASGHTIVVQPRGETTAWWDWPIDYQIELCKLRTWDVNDQCPAYDLYHRMDGGAPAALLPNDEFGEHASVDHRVTFDVYTSTQRTYLFLDGQPYACADLPAGSAPGGPVTVTWGDVLYHSAVDHVFAFHAAHMQIDTRRHFDNLGFSSGVPAPSWDESRFPCAPPLAL